MPQFFVDFIFPVTGAPTPGYPPLEPPSFRTLPKRIGEILNVKDWGAIGDGETDDTDAIVDALAAAWAYMPIVGGSRGLTVYFPPGTYRVTENINISENQDITAGGYQTMAIKGGGIDATTIVGDIPGLSVLFYGDTTAMVSDPEDETFSETADPTGTASNVTMSDFTVYNESPEPLSRAVWYKSLGTAVKFDNMRFKGVGGFGVHYNSYHPCLHDCVAECAPAIVHDVNCIGFLVGAGDVQNCRAIGFERGIAIWGIGGVVLACHVVDCTLGFDMITEAPPNSNDGVSMIAMYGCVAENCGTGFALSLMSGGVCGCVSKGSTLYGVDIRILSNSYVFAHTFDGDATDARFQQFETVQTVFAAFPAVTLTLPNPFHPTAPSYIFLDNMLEPFIAFTSLTAAFAAYQRFSWVGWTASIIDGQKSGGGTAAFGDVVAGGGDGGDLANHYKVMYNGSNFVRIA